MTTAQNIPTQITAQEAALRGIASGLFMMNGHVDVPAAQDYIFALFLPCRAIVQFGVFIASAGTLTAAFKIGATPSTGVAITGFGAVAVTTANQIVNFTANDGTNVGAVGSTILVTVSAPAGATNFDWTLAYYRQ